MKLHEAIEKVLKDENHPMTAAEITEKIKRCIYHNILRAGIFFVFSFWMLSCCDSGVPKIELTRFEDISTERQVSIRKSVMNLFNEGYEPEDFVIATGEQHTVRDFTEKAFKAVGINLKWEGKGIDEKGIDTETGKVLVEVNKEWFRPTDVDNLWGDPTKAKTVLGWNPQKTSYEELINIMVKHDLELAKHEALLKNGGEK